MKKSKSYNSRYQRDQIQAFLEKGAIILDVRSKQEWETGYIPDSKHIESTQIPNYLEEIKAYGKPVVAVCVSGYRSGEVTKYLISHGIDAINGGSWQNVADLVVIATYKLEGSL